MRFYGVVAFSAATPAFDVSTSYSAVDTLTRILFSPHLLSKKTTSADRINRRLLQRIRQRPRKEATVITWSEDMMTTLTVNGQAFEVDVDPQMPLLWVLRDVLGLTGTKFGCGLGHCWGCTVLVGGKARPSCTVKTKAVEGKEITTIECIPWDHPVKLASVEMQVPQCGYCHCGLCYYEQAFSVPGPARTA
jgi:aerobic-type carbon monoxide dehydrogenase small subunit (CoxS/CutS family)